MGTLPNGGHLSAYLAVLATAISAAALLSLHVVSSEFAPSWRMVSEYANGRHSWVLTVVFAGWAISSFALMKALWPVATSKFGQVGLAFLALAGVGQAMGGMFDINHPLHGPAAMIGIPSLCIAAVIVTASLRRVGMAAPPVWTAHLPWISFVLMLGTLALFFSQLKAAGVDVSGKTGPLNTLPPGVVGYVGWANRLLFLSSYLWTILTSITLLR